MKIPMKFCVPLAWKFSGFFVGNCWLVETQQPHWVLM